MFSIQELLSGAMQPRQRQPRQQESLGSLLQFLGGNQAQPVQLPKIDMPDPANMLNAQTQQRLAELQMRKYAEQERISQAVAQNSNILDDMLSNPLYKDYANKIAYAKMLASAGDSEGATKIMDSIKAESPHFMQMGVPGTTDKKINAMYKNGVVVPIGEPWDNKGMTIENRLTPAPPSGYHYIDNSMTRVAPIPGGPSDPANAHLNEAEGKSNSFSMMAEHADNVLKSLETNADGTPSDITKLSMKQWTEGLPVVGQGLGAIANNTLTDKQQKIDAAQREFVAAALRDQSGGAIKDEEFEYYGKMFFPRYGDSPEVVKQKQDARQVIIKGLDLKSGVASSNYGKSERFNDSVSNLGTNKSESVPSKRVPISKEDMPLFPPNVKAMKGTYNGKQYIIYKDGWMEEQ